MIPGTFEYHAPTSVSEAIQLLEQHEDAKILAGGHSLLPLMKFRFAEPSHLIDINNINELKGISIDGNHIVIGAMTCENDLISSEILQQHCPLLPFVAKLIADPQIRSRGTIGGDISHGDPANDHPAVMMALDAEFVVEGPDGERTEPANGFYMGTYWTNLGEHDLLKQIRIPKFDEHTYFGFNKLKRKTGDFATAAATAILTIRQGICEKVSISLTNVAPTPVRVEEAESMILNRAVDALPMDAIVDAVLRACDASDDLRGSAEYKQHMAGVMARRAIQDAIKQSEG